MCSIRTTQLFHQFNNGQIAVDHIDLLVPQGSIYCFLGPNGAGKTTTLRLLLGLIQAPKANIELLGIPFSENRVQLMKRIGACIEVPSLYSHLSAYENLIIYQIIYNCKRSRIDDVLRLVNLAESANKKVGAFSLGMKQRMSIAIALLHEPELVILDEPTNGLDPQGIAEIRATILDLNAQLGITFLISSHLLSEVEKLASHVGIIHQGKMKFQGTMNELYQASSSDAKLIVRTSNDAAAIPLIESHFQLTPVASEPLTYSLIDQSLSLQINRLLHENQIGVSQLHCVDNDLETHFLRLIQNTKS